jgi:hypothetical protein
MLYPTYEGTSMAAPPLLRLKFLNLAQSAVDGAGLTGTSGGFTYTPDFEQGVFDVGRGTIYPKVVKLECTFTALHEHQMGFDAPEWGSFPYNSVSDVSEPNMTAPTPTTPASDTASSAVDEGAAPSPTAPTAGVVQDTQSQAAQVTLTTPKKTATPKQKKMSPIARQLKKIAEDNKKLRDARKAAGLDPITGKRIKP